MAWPPSIWVATQVVRSIEWKRGSFDTMAFASASSGLATSRSIAGPIGAGVILPSELKVARVTSLIRIGNSWAAMPVSAADNA